MRQYQCRRARRRTRHRTKYLSRFSRTRNCPGEYRGGNQPDIREMVEMAADFQQLEWSPAIEDDLRQIVRLAVREDLDRGHDWTTLAIVSSEEQGRASVVV